MREKSCRHIERFWRFGTIGAIGIDAEFTRRPRTDQRAGVLAVLNQRNRCGLEKAIALKPGRNTIFSVFGERDAAV